jgi:hypothetical protein
MLWCWQIHVRVLDRRWGSCSLIHEFQPLYPQQFLMDFLVFRQRWWRRSLRVRRSTSGPLNAERSNLSAVIDLMCDRFHSRGRYPPGLPSWRSSSVASLTRGHWVPSQGPPCLNRCSSSWLAWLSMPQMCRQLTEQRALKTRRRLQDPSRGTCPVVAHFFEFPREERKMNKFFLEDL